MSRCGRCSRCPPSAADVGVALPRVTDFASMLPPSSCGRRFEPARGAPSMKAGSSRQHPQFVLSHHCISPRLAYGYLPGRAPLRVAAPDPVAEPGDRHVPSAGAGHRAGRSRRHEAPAAGSARGLAVGLVRRLDCFLCRAHHGRGAGRFHLGAGSCSGARDDRLLHDAGPDPSSIWAPPDRPGLLRRERWPLPSASRRCVAAGCSGCRSPCPARVDDRTDALDGTEWLSSVGLSSCLPCLGKRSACPVRRRPRPLTASSRSGSGADEGCRSSCRGSCWRRRTLRRSTACRHRSRPRGGPARSPDTSQS